MAQFNVTLVSEPGQVVDLFGLGAFRAGEARVVELTPDQARSLAAKGLVVEELETEPEPVKRTRRGGGGA